MEENKKYRNTNKRVGVFWVVCIVGLISLYGLLETYYIQKNGVYIICPVRYVKRVRSGNLISLNYNFRDREYHSSGVSSIIKSKDDGSRYFVQILPDNPKFHRLTDIEVPYDITEVPPEGWKELPVLE